MGDSHDRKDGSVDFAERDTQSSLDNGNRILYGAGVKDFLAFGVQFAEGNKQVNVRGDGALWRSSRTGDGYTIQNVSGDLEGRGCLIAESDWLSVVE